MEVAGSLHLELIHSGTSLGNVNLIAILTGHNQFLLFLIVVTNDSWVNWVSQG